MKDTFAYCIVLTMEATPMVLLKVSTRFSYLKKKINWLTYNFNVLQPTRGIILIFTLVTISLKKVESHYKVW